MKKLLIFACLILIGCNDNFNTFQPVEESERSVQSLTKGWVGRELKLKVGQEVILKKENLKIKFTSVVEDSRCPVDVICFWSGNAGVALTYQKNSSIPVNDTLNTHLEPRLIKYLNYQIILKDLEPYPVSTEPIPPGEYIATILVSKTYPVRDIRINN